MTTPAEVAKKVLKLSPAAARNLWFEYVPSNWNGAQMVEFIGLIFQHVEQNRAQLIASWNQYCHDIAMYVPIVPKNTWRPGR